MTRFDWTPSDRRASEAARIFSESIDMTPNEIDVVTGLPIADGAPATMPTPDMDAVVRRLADWADYNRIDPTAGNGLGGPAGAPPGPIAPSWFGDWLNSVWDATCQGALNMARVVL